MAEFVQLEKEYWDATPDVIGDLIVRLGQYQKDNAEYKKYLHYEKIRAEQAAEAKQIKLAKERENWIIREDSDNLASAVKNGIIGVVVALVLALIPGTCVAAAFGDKVFLVVMAIVGIIGFVYAYTMTRK